MEPKEITIISTDTHPETDHRPVRLLVTRETGLAWFGKPVDKPASSEMQWPKHAWREVKE
jgi:hypothetical protein